MSSSEQQESIIVETISSLPSKIIELIEANKDELNDEYNGENHYIETGECYIKSFPTPVKNKIKEELKKMLLGKNFKCFHCTRLLDKNEILQNGLKKLCIKELKTRVFRVLKHYLTDQQIKILIDSFDGYNEGTFGSRENMIWFVSSQRLAKSKGCDPFYQYYGGEATRRILSEHENIFLPILSKIGSPMIIECELEFKEIKDYHFDYLVNTLLSNFIENIEEINWEFYLEKNIEPERICKVHKVNHPRQ